MKYILLASILFLLAGCNNSEPVQSFEGKFLSVEPSNTLSIECTSVATRNQTDSTDVGHLCEVEVTDNTVIKLENGKNIDLNKLEELNINKVNTPKNVRVVLTEERDINKKPNSRKGLKASKVVISD